MTGISASANGLLSEIARRYQIEGETQDAIARALDLSRIKVNRLLREAEGRGIVEVRVRYQSSRTRALERTFARCFGLRQLLIAPPAGSPERQRANVATVASAYLEAHLREGMVVAAGMGRNVSAIASVEVQARFDDLTFVCGSGGATEAGEQGNADHICRALAKRYGGRPATLYAPAYVPDAAMRQALMRHETVRRTRQPRAWGRFRPRGDRRSGQRQSHRARMGWFGAEELRAAQSDGVAGDLIGDDFFDRDGDARNDRLGGHVVGLTREDLSRIGTTIAIAAEDSKASAILGALRTRAIDVLATSISNCVAIAHELGEGGRSAWNGTAS